MPRRILLLITDLEIGGTPTVVRELAVRLNEPPAIEIEVACLKQRGPVAQQLGNHGIEVTAFGAARPWQLNSVVRRLRQLVRERRIDTVLSFLVHANAIAALASRRLPNVRFLQSIQTTQPRPRWHWMVQRWASKYARQIIVPSPSAAETARRRSHVEAEKVVVIPNAVEFHGSEATLQNPAFSVQISASSVQRSAFPVGFIGRLDPVKRLVDLVQAAGLLGDRVHLHIFGDGPQRRLIAGLTSDNMIWHGAIADPREALARIGLLVLPSLAEGFGLVLIEAMAAGVPVIGTDVPGIRDVVQDGVNGLLVRPFDPAGLARAIVRIIDDAALRQRLIAGGLAAVRERYSWPVVLPMYQALLKLELPGQAVNPNVEMINPTQI